MSTSSDRVGDELVDPDDHVLTGLVALVVARADSSISFCMKSRVTSRPLRDLLHQFLGPQLDLVGQRLDEVGAGERVDRVGAPDS